MLFIPGSGSGREIWAYQSAHFANSEAVALPGHPEGKPCSSIEDYVEWLRDYVRQHEYRDVILAGHSMGSAIAQLYGLRYGEELKALVLIGAGARLRVLPVHMEEVKGMIGDETAWREFLEDSYSHVAPEIASTVVEARMRIGPAAFLNDLLCCDKFDIMGEVQGIKLPTLVICGGEDVMTPAKYTRYLADKIEAATAVVIEGAGHRVHLEKPGEVNQAIEAFLARLS